MGQSLTQLEALTWASNFLKASGREAYVANVLLAYHLQIDTSQLHETMGEIIPEEGLKAFQADVRAHVETGIPVQYITNEAYFYGRKFYVDERVLIPRYDTEFLLQSVMDYVQQHIKGPVTIVDIGTGSGIIAITLALELPHAKVYATDISAEALQVAKRNADYYDQSISFLHGSYLEPIMEANINPQIIVSNPPYIPEGESVMLTDTVKGYEPIHALYGGVSGDEAYEAITRQASQLSPEPNLLAFEIGYNQGEPVRKIVQKYFPLADPLVIPDFQANDRVVFANLASHV